MCVFPLHFEAHFFAADGEDEAPHFSSKNYFLRCATLARDKTHIHSSNFMCSYLACLNLSFLPTSIFVCLSLLEYVCISILSTFVYSSACYTQMHGKMSSSRSSCYSLYECWISFLLSLHNYMYTKLFAFIFLCLEIRTHTTSLVSFVRLSFFLCLLLCFPVFDSFPHLYVGYTIITVAFLGSIEWTLIHTHTHKKRATSMCVCTTHTQLQMSKSMLLLLFFPSFTRYARTSYRWRQSVFMLLNRLKGRERERNRVLCVYRK